jgi:endonuclease/exonuclease/phosphatase family metal-dependent hydrolase
MKIIKLFILLFPLIFMGGNYFNDSPSVLKVMTFNIRYDNPDDGENAWKVRKNYVAGIIKNNNVDFVGIQEGLKNQVDYLSRELRDYNRIGIGRDDGKEAGEYSAIFFKAEKFEKLESNTFWLSETPGKPGLGWDAVCNRIVTWGKFKDKKTGKIFYIFNTHFDHMGVLARRNSALLIKRTIDSLCSGEPVIITGDFNSSADSEPYRIITASGGSHKYFFDNSENISSAKHDGPEGTFTGFDINKDPTGPIDFIFVSKGIKVDSHKTISARFNNHYPSDHFPVLSEVALE